ncbi:hypothetical protein [Ectobacillus sp. sgz5001026]|uniref:hypothetical protein n=1 Tax=Ectobacillus sp. sgz5001026 TaxID=3242473 RepID=UPI0036D3E54B
MQKNAKSYVQDSCQALNQAASCLQDALQTVEKANNRQQIQSSLQAVQGAITQCTSVEQALSQE